MYPTIAVVRMSAWRSRSEWTSSIRRRVGLLWPGRSVGSSGGWACCGCCRRCCRGLIGDAVADGVCCQCDPVGVAELLEQVLDVGGDGSPGDVQLLGGLTVGETGGDEREHPRLGGGQAV